MRLIALALLAAPAAAQSVAECEPPPVTALLEPWEETTSTLGAGSIRVAAIEDEGGVALLVLTLPPVGEEGGEPEVPAERRCRLVAEGGIGFASLNVTGLGVTEDAEAATLTATVPALRFVPESSELEEVTLRLTFGVADDSLEAALETADGATDEGADETAEAAAEGAAEAP
jgi:hypothetical protein